MYSENISGVNSIPTVLPFHFFQDLCGADKCAPIFSNSVHTKSYLVFVIVFGSIPLISWNFPNVPSPTLCIKPPVSQSYSSASKSCQNEGSTALIAPAADVCTFSR